ncbi:MAG TPA: galactokinase [Treponema sp.]|nr:MAG: galactokinase [Treponema sp. GWA1_62_8]OHE65055.1 MAG: galactokinase [Treponema sp. GWC1_61_84]OHE72457.1 MAG: galactokinase [Treponema sp. RIFOXYC1_FULL_61_9]HCM26040.1 galactokinase [Treponema sp.]
MKDIGPIHREEYETDSDRTETLYISEAPGRIHLLGEHGDPSGGLLLSAGIDRSVRVAMTARKDSSLRFFAADLGERKRTTLINLKYKREDRWANFIKLAVHGFAERDYPIKGLNFTLSGDIPQQVGLASSSAIEVAAAVVLRAHFAPEMDDSELIEVLSEASVGFFGRARGSVDHLVLLSALKDRFLVVDARDLSVRPVELPFAGYRIILTDSRVPRFGVDGELKQRRADIKRGLELLSRKQDGASLRDYAVEDLIESMGSLPEQLRRRSLHVVKETQRVLEAEEALKKGDLPSLAKIVYHSHESLRDLYEVSCPEIDWLVKRAQEIEGVLCSRMTGQGFGGCTYSIVAEGAVAEYRRRLEDYERIFGFRPLIHEISVARSARIVQE